MPLTRFKLSSIVDGGIDTAKLADGAVTVAKTDSLFTNAVFDGDFVKVPSGTTAQRPITPNAGYLRHNTTLGKIEQYDGNDWKPIDISPTVSSISNASIPESDNAYALTITGDNFDSGATVVAIGQDGSTINPSSTSRTNAQELVATFDGSGFDDAQEPYDIKVINPSGISITFANSLNLNATPSWVSDASPTVLSDIIQSDSISSLSVSATDPESGTLSYSISSGSLPTGVTLNADGTITGTPSGGSYASGGESFTPTIQATDGSNTITRTFNIVRKWRDGSTSALANSSAANILSINSSATDGFYYITINGTPKEVYCDMAGGGWMYIMPKAGANDSNPFGATIAANSNSTACYGGSVTYNDSHGWYAATAYTCGTTSLYVQPYVLFTKPSDITFSQVRFTAASSGISQGVSFTGTNLTVNRQNSRNAFWDSSSFTCNTNTCMFGSTYLNAVEDQNAHIVRNHSTNFNIYNIAYSEGGSFGGGPIISLVAIK